MQTNSIEPFRRRIDALYKNINFLNDLLTNMSTSVPTSDLTVRLQHAQALLSSDIDEHFRRALDDFAAEMTADVGQYIEHVKQEVSFS